MPAENLATFTLMKADAKHGVLFGFGIVCKVRNAVSGELEQYYDDGSEGAPDYSDGISDEEMLKGAVEFMASDRAIEEEHRGPKIGGTVLFGFPLTEDIAKALGIETRQTGLLVGVRPDDPEILAKAARGEIKGFSIFGGCKSIEVVA